ncbi:MAG: hypothetical protein LCH63_14710 [Candidatus Melainabacteria bacterium]|nr:hypothetical protein [Candidatus Melainabacteria bacterium]OPZ91622.1 MAG: hypothetical protein BWY75_00235 [bacterium ADurb.Bin425]
MNNYRESSEQSNSSKTARTSKLARRKVAKRRNRDEASFDSVMQERKLRYASNISEFGLLCELAHRNTVLMTRPLVYDLCLHFQCEDLNLLGKLVSYWTGVSEATLRRCLKGWRVPRLSTLVDIAEASNLKLVVCVSPLNPLSPLGSVRSVKPVKPVKALNPNYRQSPVDKLEQDRGLESGTSLASISRDSVSPAAFCGETVCAPNQVVRCISALISRLTAAYSPTFLRDACGISCQSLTRIKRGQNASLLTYQKLLAAFGLTMRLRLSRP